MRAACIRHDYVVRFREVETQTGYAPTSVRLTPEAREQLEQIAAREERSVAWLIRRAVDNFIAEAQR